MTLHALLNFDEHQSLRLNPRRHPNLGDAVMSCLLMPSEFRRAQTHYPILFHKTPGQDLATAIALFGFEAQENLFLNQDTWCADYIPLAHRIQPFLIGPVTETGQRQIHIDLDSPRWAKDNDPGSLDLFFKDGSASPFLSQIAEDLGELDLAHHQGQDFFLALKRYDLLEPLAVEFKLDEDHFTRLVGFHTLNEARLKDLDADALGDLHGEGHLQMIFMALASLNCLSSLIALKSARLRHD